MEKKVFWIIAGTSEARALIQRLGGTDATVYVSVATTYGASLIDSQPNVKVMLKRMEYAQMLDFIKQYKPSCVIDATHPYAQIVTQNISRACLDTNTDFLRLYRAESSYGDDIIHVENTCAAVEFLRNTVGRVFLSTGSKELHEFCRLADYQERIYARILPMIEGLSKAVELGFSPKKIICMQGPFSKELNKAMLKDCGADYLVTKNSGSNGGFVEKLEAAAELGVKVIVIGRPPDVQGLPADAIWTRLRELMGYA